MLLLESECSGDDGTGWMALPSSSICTGRMNFRGKLAFLRENQHFSGKIPLGSAGVSPAPASAAECRHHSPSSVPPLLPGWNQTWIIGLFMSHIRDIAERTFPAWISCSTSDPTGSTGQPSPSSLLECPWDIFIIPWVFSALGAWGGAAGPPHIQSLLFPANVNPRERAQRSPPAR